MPHIDEWLRRFWYLLNRRRLEAALREEIEAHRAVMDDPRRFGNALQFREHSRDVWGWGWLDALVRDLRFAARNLRRSPLFTIVAIASLALGFALTTSMVSVVNGYLIRPLPYPESDRLYHVRYAPPGPWEPRGMSGLDWASVNDVVEYPITASGESFYLSGVVNPLPLRGLRVTRGFTDGLGVVPIVGRRLTEQDFMAGSERVALIGYAVWRDRFASSAGVIGQLLRVESESGAGRPELFRIVGVLAPGFYFGNDSRSSLDVLVPQTAPTRTYMVRLQRGVPRAMAERRLTEAARGAATEPIPAEWTGIQLESAHDRWVSGLQPVLVGVTVAVSLVLVIVCANVAVLLVLRSLQRRKEVAVRLALGSNWQNVARMLLAEISLIAAAGAGGGVAISALFLSTLTPVIETQLGRPAPSALGITIDPTVLLLVGGVCAVIVVALSVAPLESWRHGIAHALQEDARTASEGQSMRRLRSALIAFELAGSLVLLIGCGLMIRSVVTMLGTDLGFDPDGLVRSRIMLRARNYPDAAAFRSFHERFASRVSGASGSTVVFSTWPPYVPPPVHLVVPDAGTTTQAGSISVSAGYFSIFGIGLRQGREFTADEASHDAPVAVISESLARRLWPDSNVIGKRIQDVEDTPAGVTTGPWRTVVGVATDVHQAYGDEDRNDLYEPKTPDGRFATFYLRTGRPLPRLFEDLRQIASEIDSDAVINPPRLVADDDQTLVATRFLTFLLSGFAGVAGFLAMLGIYGVTAYAAEQRQKEVAIRQALGASAAGIVGMFLRQSSQLLGVGTASGVIGGLVLSRGLRSHIIGVQTFDWPTYVIASGLLLGAGVSTVYWVARRAALRDPVTSLKSA